jgi:tetratricopeptide (TPR) repeat protein
MPDSPPAEHQGAVFLSYASHDAEAAKRICAALRGAGIEVWFDQSELRGGDAWDKKIRRQIKECALFVPVISGNTNLLLEGYFRREWKQAVERTNDMDEDLPFLVPVVIDGTSDAGAHAPEKFRQVQWTRLQGRETPQAFSERVRKLLSGPDGEPGHPAPTTVGHAFVSHQVPATRAWLIPSIIGVIACMALAIWQPWRKGEKPAAPAPTAGSEAEIRQLLDRATAMTTVNATLDDISKEAYETAGKLIEQAKALNPMDGEVWAKEAINDLSFISMGYDRSPERKAKAAAEATRAMELNPKSYAARSAHAGVIQVVVAPAGGSQEAEHLLRELLSENPNDQVNQIALGQVLESGNRFGEAADFLLKAKIPLLAAWDYFADGQIEKANAAADQALAMKRSVKNLWGKIIVMQVAEDRNAALSLLAEIPPSAYTDDKTAEGLASALILYREPEKGLEGSECLPSGLDGDVEVFRGESRVCRHSPHAGREAGRGACRMERRFAAN